MRRTLALVGAVSFVSAFLGGMLALSLVSPGPATAQSAVAPVLRAATFELVRNDGTVIGRLAPGPAGGGSLVLSHPGGTTGLALAGGGLMTAYDGVSEQPTFRAGRCCGASPDVNGVQLGPDGSVSMLAPQP
jgi:hypothetical protein